VPISGSTPERVLACFTDRSQLESWWGGELDAELVQGGRYVVRFAELGRAMVGRVLKYDPPSSMEFSWSWHAAGEDPARTVALFIHHGKTTTLTIVHGPTVMTNQNAPRANSTEPPGITSFRDSR
jgi:uncharacterized protein YndB with AHSA1/START domain